MMESRINSLPIYHKLIGNLRVLTSVKIMNKDSKFSD